MCEVRGCSVVASIVFHDGFRGQRDVLRVRGETVEGCDAAGETLCAIEKLDLTDSEAHCVVVLVLRDCAVASELTFIVI